MINQKYPQENNITADSINLIIDEIFDEYKEDYLVREYSKYLTKQKSIQENTPVLSYGDTVKIQFNKDARSMLSEEDKKNIVPGKEVIKRIRNELIIKNTPQQKQFVLDLINNMNKDNVDEDIETFLEYIRQYS